MLPSNGRRDSYGDAATRRKGEGDHDEGDAGRAVLRHGPISIRSGWRNHEGGRDRPTPQRIPAGPMDRSNPSRGRWGPVGPDPYQRGELPHPVMQGTASPTPGCRRLPGREPRLQRSEIPNGTPRYRSSRPSRAPRPLRLRLPLVALAHDSGSAAAPLQPPPALLSSPNSTEDWAEAVP